MNESQIGSSYPTLVISGVGMKEGGILTVLRNVVAAAEKLLPPQWRIVVLAHRSELVDCTRAEVREYPTIKASWFKRVWFEWRTSQKIAREVSATVWLAMQDITPLVDVERQYVYCHNPTTFTKPTWTALYFDWVFVAHSLMYGFLYSLNIRRNQGVFVQQSWIREEFIRRFGALPDMVIVSRPPRQTETPFSSTIGSTLPSPLRRWIFPTFPRHFKNVEVICQALQLLEHEGGWTGEILVTIDGDENRYARWLKGRYGNLRSLKWIGRQSTEQMQEAYRSVDGLIFPSTLETWGLPISEAQSLGLPLLVADLRYAHETVGNYDTVTFFDPFDPSALAFELKALSCGRTRLGRATVTSDLTIPALNGWDELILKVCQ